MTEYGTDCYLCNQFNIQDSDWSNHATTCGLETNAHKLKALPIVIQNQVPILCTQCHSNPMRVVPVTRYFKDFGSIKAPLREYCNTKKTTLGLLLFGIN